MIRSRDGAASAPGFATALVAITLAIALAAGCEPAPPEGSLAAAFALAERDTGVPADVLSAVAWVSSRYVHRAETVTTAHESMAYGVMGIYDRWPRYDLGRGAAFAGVSADDAARDRTLNVLAGAHVIARRAMDLSPDGTRPRPNDLTAWVAAAADVVGGGTGYAVAAARDDLVAALRLGASRTLEDGETVALFPREVGDVALGRVTHALADYPGALWVPASSANYTDGRGGNSINYVVIHTTQGSYAGAISWFQNSSSSVSAHFVIRSSDGEVTQTVDLADTAWHAGNWSYNQQSVGIEHEGWVDDASWYTTEMYMSSAAVTAWVADTYGVLKDRAHIIGHSEVPGATHTDPGVNWDWDYYMALVTAPDLPPFAATLTALDAPTVMVSGEERVAWIEYANDGANTWSANTRLGTTNPRDRDSDFYHPANWLGPTRPTAADVLAGPGDVARFSFVLLAPDVDQPTAYTEYFNLVEEGVEWFGPCDDCVALSITVLPATAAGPGPDPDPMDPDPLDPVDPDGGLTGSCACAAVGARASSVPATAALAWLAPLGLALALSRRRQRA